MPQPTEPPARARKTVFHQAAPLYQPLAASFPQRCLSPLPSHRTLMSLGKFSQGGMERPPEGATRCPPPVLVGPTLPVAPSSHSSVDLVVSALLRHHRPEQRGSFPQDSLPTWPRRCEPRAAWGGCPVQQGAPRGGQGRGRRERRPIRRAGQRLSQQAGGAPNTLAKARSLLKRVAKERL